MVPTWVHLRDIPADELFKKNWAGQTHWSPKSGEKKWICHVTNHKLPEKRKFQSLWHSRLLDWFKGIHPFQLSSVLWRWLQSCQLSYICSIGLLVGGGTIAIQFIGSDYQRGEVMAQPGDDFCPLNIALGNLYQIVLGRRSNEFASASHYTCHLQHIDLWSCTKWKFFYH